jgi:hypothetical protein
MKGHSLIVLGVLLAAAAPTYAQQKPSGMVEDLQSAPQAGVDLMEFVSPGQRIPLGKDGQLVLNYFQSCRVETVRGGTITVGQTESRIDGGTVRAQNRPCDPKKFAATTKTAEPGALAIRAVPGSTDDGEVSLKSDRPVFRWESGGATVRIFAVDTPTPKLVWSGTAEKSWIEYPATAPKLQPSVPYLVDVNTKTGKKGQVNFIIEPGARPDDAAMNRIVLVGSK